MAENRSNFEPELELGSPVVQEATLDRSRMGTNIAQFQRAVADATEDGKHSTGKQRQGLRFWPKQVKKEQDEANRSTPTALPVSKNMTHGDNGFVDSSNMREPVEEEEEKAEEVAPELPRTLQDYVQEVQPVPSNEQDASPINYSRTEKIRIPGPVQPGAHYAATGSRPVRVQSIRMADFSNEAENARILLPTSTDVAISAPVAPSRDDTHGGNGNNTSRASAERAENVNNLVQARAVHSEPQILINADELDPNKEAATGKKEVPTGCLDGNACYCRSGGDEFYWPFIWKMFSTRKQSMPRRRSTLEAPVHEHNDDTH